MRVYSGASDFVLRFFMLSLSLSLTFSFPLALTFFTPSPLFCLFCLLLSYRTCLFAICFFPSSPLCKDRVETRETSHKNKKRAKMCRPPRVACNQCTKAHKKRAKKCAGTPAVAHEQCARAQKRARMHQKICHSVQPTYQSTRKTRQKCIKNPVLACKQCIKGTQKVRKKMCRKPCRGARIMRQST